MTERTRKYRTDFGTVTETSHDGGKTWRESHREELPQQPSDESVLAAQSKPSDQTESRPPPERTSCSHQTYGICLTCSNADTVARREAADA